jgi:hypothetical protein
LFEKAEKPWSVPYFSLSSMRKDAAISSCIGEHITRGQATVLFEKAEKSVGCPHFHWIAAVSLP